MASIYEKINTPKQVVEEVQKHCLCTTNEDIVRLQDIFGRAPIKDLVSLANDKDTEDTFYFILSKIWNCRDVIGFFNEHSNPDNPAQLKWRNERIEKSLKEKIERLNEVEKKCLAEVSRANSLEAENKRLKNQIVELKAKLYDFLTESKI